MKNTSRWQLQTRWQGGFLNGKLFFMQCMFPQWNYIQIREPLRGGWLGLYWFMWFSNLHPSTRLCLLLLVVTALGGTWMVEQPDQSVLEYFPPFQSVLAQLYEAFGGTAVPTLKFNLVLMHIIPIQTIGIISIFRSLYITMMNDKGCMGIGSYTTLNHIPL